MAFLLTLPKLVICCLIVQRIAVSRGKQQSNYIQQKIFGGEDAEEGEFPYLVSMTHTSNGIELVCCGIILNEFWVLTAARCAYDILGPDTNAVKLTPDEFGYVVAGNLRRVNSVHGEERRKVESLIVHPAYDPDDLTYPDLALLKMTQPFAFSSHKIEAYVGLPVEEEIPDTGNVCLTPGWGLDESNKLTDYLRKSSMTIIDQTHCREAYNSQLIYVPDGYICATGDLGSGMCFGDFGCPLICGQNIVGLASSSGSGCGEAGYPGVFANVGRYRAWIMETMEKAFPSTTATENTSGSHQHIQENGSHAEERDNSIPPILASSASSKIHNDKLICLQQIILLTIFIFLL